TPPLRTGSHEKLRFAVEPKRQLQNYAKRDEIGERVSEVWQQVFFPLMEIASKGRVYCHPGLRDVLMTALGPDRIRDAVNAAVTKMGVQRNRAGCPCCVSGEWSLLGEVGRS